MIPFPAEIGFAASNGSSVWRSFEEYLRHHPGIYNDCYDFRRNRI